MKKSQVERSVGAIAARVKACLAESNITQRELSRSTGLDETKLSKSLSGVRQFKAEELVGIATVAGVTVNWLITGSDTSAGSVAVPSATSLPQQVRDTPDRMQRRREIVEAAWRLFAQQGLHRTRIADIAEACDVSNSAVLYHFKDKQELFEECLRYSVKLAFDRQVATLNSAQRPREKLAYLMDLQLPDDDQLQADWSIWLQSWNSVAVEGGSEENHANAYNRWYRTVFDVIAEGQETGLIIAEPTEELTAHLTSLFDGYGVKVLVGIESPSGMRRKVNNFIDRFLFVPSSRPVPPGTRS